MCPVSALLHFFSQVLRFSRLFKPVHNPHIWRKRRKKKEKDEEKKEGEEGKEEGEKSSQEEEKEEEEEFLTDEELNKLLKLDMGRAPQPHELAPDDEVNTEYRHFIQ